MVSAPLSAKFHVAGAGRFHARGEILTDRSAAGTMISASEHYNSE